MYSSWSSTWVQDASLLSRRPSMADMDSPDAQTPANPASSTIFADRPLCASIRKPRAGDPSMARRAAARLPAEGLGGGIAVSCVSGIGFSGRVARCGSQGVQSSVECDRM